MIDINNVVFNMVFMHEETFDIYAGDGGVATGYFAVDDLIALPIQILNRKGYTTEFCCSGHIWSTYYATKNSDTTEFILGRNNSFHSYIVFKDDISLPTLPLGFSVVDKMNPNYNYWSFGSEYKPELDKKIFLERYYADTGVYGTLRDMLDAMEQLCEWASNLPDFTDCDNENAVTQDDNPAEYWYGKAAEQGYVSAQYSLAEFYYYGKATKQDYKQAVYWYTKAAAQGKGEAQCDLGHCYENGYGVEKDCKQAVFWYKKAAEQGDDTAQCNLGECYEHGRGVAQDYKQAEYWYKKSAEQGYQDAIKALENYRGE